MRKAAQFFSLSFVYLLLTLSSPGLSSQLSNSPQPSLEILDYGQELDAFFEFSAYYKSCSSELSSFGFLGKLWILKLMGKGKFCDQFVRKKKLLSEELVQVIYPLSSEVGFVKDDQVERMLQTLPSMYDNENIFSERLGLAFTLFYQKREMARNESELFKEILETAPKTETDLLFEDL